MSLSGFRMGDYDSFLLTIRKNNGPPDHVTKIEQEDLTLEGKMSQNFIMGLNSVQGMYF